jgi:NitT/TauT family transport system substrate-binding protein
MAQEWRTRHEQLSRRLILSTETQLSRRQLGILGAAAAVGSVPLLSSCTSDSKTTTAPKDADKVTYLTGFGAAGRESHAWVAKSKGFFREAGLDVTIQLGAAGDSNHKLLASGQAQFAGVDASGAFIRYGKGVDTSFQIVGAVQQTTLISIITLEGSGINGPKDLIGRKVGGATGAAPKTLFPAYTKLANIDIAKVNWIDMELNQLTSSLVTGKVDGVALFVVAQPGVEKAAGGKKTRALTYSEFLADLFGTVLVAPKKLIESNPDLVRRFNGALMRGVQYAVEHPEEAGQILKQEQPTQDADIAKQEVGLMRQYALPNPGNVVGVLDPARVAKTIALLQSTELIPAGLKPEDIVKFDMLGTAPKVV